MVRYARSFQAYRRTVLKKRKRAGIEILTYIGPTGVGKSTLVETKFPLSNSYWLSRNRSGPTWWCGYDSEETIVIDEFEGWIAQSDMQRICDNKPLSLQVKCSAAWALYNRVVIISNYHPGEWWRDGLRAPMKSRLFGQDGRNGHVYKIEERGAEPVEVGVDDHWISQRVFSERNNRN